MLLKRAEKAGAAIEKTRVLGIERREQGLASAHAGGHRRGRLLHRRDRRAQSAARSGHGVERDGHDERAGLLRAGVARSHRYSISAAAGRLHLGVPALRAIFRWASAARASRRKRCARGWSATWTSAASRGKGRNVLQPHAAVARIAGMEEESRGGRWMDGGGRRRRAGGSDHRRRFVLRDALGRSGEPRGARRRARNSRKRPRRIARCWRASLRVDLEFAATLARARVPGHVSCSTRCRRG